MASPVSGGPAPGRRPAPAPGQGDGAASDNVPSPARRHFDDLLQRLEQARAVLRAWGVALPRWQQRYLTQAVPLFERRAVRERELLSLLEHAHAGFGLGKAERGFLAGLIGSLDARRREDHAQPRGPGVGEGSHDRSGGGHHDRPGEDPAAAERLRQALAAHLGVEPEDVDRIEVPDALLHDLRERERMRQAHAHGRGERTRAKARQAKASGVGQAAPAVPLRALYRKLAAVLHPDREPDPDEQVRKTALMQRINRAYRAGDLLELIELQQQVGQLRPEQLQAMGEQGLRAYNRDLERQLVELRQERARLETAFRRDHGFDAGQRLDPERLDALLARIKRQLAGEIAWLEADLRQLQDPERFRAWLKAQRRHADL